MNEGWVFEEVYIPQKRTKEVQKEKIYLKPGQQAPQGKQTMTGPKGGVYYMGDEKEAQAQEVEPKSGSQENDEIRANIQKDIEHVEYMVQLIDGVDTTNDPDGPSSVKMLKEMLKFVIVQDLKSKLDAKNEKMFGYYAEQLFAQADLISPYDTFDRHTTCGYIRNIIVKLQSNLEMISDKFLQAHQQVEQMVRERAFTQFEQISVRQYTGGMHVSINHYLRNDYLQEGEGKGYYDVNEKRQITDTIDGLVMILAKLPSYQGLTYRGMRFDSRMDRDKFVEKLVEGQSFTFKGFLSTSVVDGIAKDFMGKDTTSIMFKMVSRNGKPLNGLSGAIYEKEVLFNRESRFVIKKVTEDQATGLVEVELDEQ